LDHPISQPKIDDKMFWATAKILQTMTKKFQLLDQWWKPNNYQLFKQKFSRQKPKNF